MSSHTLNPFPEELLAAKKQIREQARSYGLDFYPTIFEMCDYETMNQIAAYGGFPQRYPHWRFGAEYEGLRKRHHYGLGRIYEMVINNDPCYAYLQESNPLVDQKLVMAHVYGHCDFFKNNLWFSKTNRKMMDEMANHATRVRRHIEKHGYDVVEHFLDICLSLEHLIDPHSMFLNRGPVDSAHVEPSRQEQTGKFKAKDYMDRWVNPPAIIEAEQKKRREEQAKQRHHTPAHATRDVLLYLLQHARLEDWQIDCLSIVREESYYYAPQAMTKVMNEGWASFWHSTLMTKHFLDSTEVIDYADHHSGTVHMPPGNFNPYKIGIELFRDIEDRWNKGKFGKEYEESQNLGEKKNWDKGLGLGREKIFEVRRVYNDVNFIDEFMTPEFIEKHKFYQYGRDPHTGQMRILSRDPQRIKQTLLYQLTNMGQPFIYVLDGNYCNRGELYLAHKHNGPDIEIKFAVETLKNLYKLWQRPVHLQARIDDEMTLFSYAGEQYRQQTIHDDLPPPAHRI
ncbi:MAG TPA: SpoVR family protein [Tepidisphaeraceae bacterium]|jgi:stage V sporulation protein R|nr:SpoVR family protein [Tepidisphaeraceae bacterium]